MRASEEGEDRAYLEFLHTAYVHYVALPPAAPFIT